jgi:hypothetical protein
MSSEPMMRTVMDRTATCIALLAAGSLLLPACGARTGPSTSGSPPTGFVIGHVTAGPTCPVERVGHPCAPRPVVAEVQATAAGRIVASTRSGADGAYRFALPSGTYTVGAVTQNMLPRCADRTVTVTAAHTIVGDITCDTGIR